MLSSFNLTKLNSLLKDFYNLTRIRITVFDENFQELAAYPPQHSSFCQTIRADESLLARCRECDKHACEIASRQRSSYTYLCHAGLTENITPLYLGNILIGYLFFGQVFHYDSHEAGWEQIRSLCADYRIDPETLKACCLEKPLISDDYIHSASHILEAVASYVCLEHMAVLRHKPLAVQIDEYIQEHYTENIDASSICAHFSIGRTQLYEIAAQCYNTGIAQHIRELRIEKAKLLLTTSPKMPVSRIAADCGFSDYNYFITVFKRMTGVPPKAFRNQN